MNWKRSPRLVLAAALVSVALMSGCSTCGTAQEDADPYVEPGDGERMQEEMAEDVILDSER